MILYKNLLIGFVISIKMYKFVKIIYKRENKLNQIIIKDNRCELKKGDFIVFNYLNNKNFNIFKLIKYNG